MRKRVADIVKEILIENQIRDCFMLTGGGAMHLNDALGNAEDSLKCTYFLHEQGAAIAAEAYARVNNEMPVVCVTTGPGGVNALTGVLCAWQDNIPMLVLSGQVKTNSMIESTGLELRQFGEQEYNIIDSVKSMTKFAVTVMNAKKIKYYIQKAIYIANSGRRGPCWIDIPLDIQGTYIEDTELENFVPEKHEKTAEFEQVIELLEKSNRPLIIAGSAIRTAEAHKEFMDMCHKMRIPIIAAKSVSDLLSNDEDMYFGNFGINGGRAGNFIVQNADCILVLGCRLSFGQIGFNYKEFSTNSIKIVIDVDKNELMKNTVHIECPINADIKEFLKWFNHQKISMDIDSKWIRYCIELRNTFPIYQTKFKFRKNVNAYYFANVLQKYMAKDGICIVGNSCSSISIKQCGIVNKRQRMWGNINCGTMGYDIPASIGAAIAARNRQIICCTGDGSFQMNIQELQTIVNYNLPIKIFIFNNAGYRSIALSQSKNFGRLSGCTRESGLILPQIQKIAYAYEFPYYRCEKNENLPEVIGDILSSEGYAICEIIEDEEHMIEPKLGNKILDDGQIVSPTLTDMFPILENEIYDKYVKFELYDENTNK